MSSEEDEYFVPDMCPSPDYGMVVNDGGGVSYCIDNMSMFHRFLILGNESSSYVASNSLEGLTCSCIELLLSKGKANEMLQMILRVSMEGLAPKQSYLLFALAKMAEFSEETRRLVFEVALGPVCRTFSALAEFLHHFDKLSWGSNTRKAVSRWMFQQLPRDLAYQFTKYRNRYGFTPRDVLRLSHPKPIGHMDAYNDVFAYAVGKWNPRNCVSPIAEYLIAADAIRTTTCLHTAKHLIEKHRFGWEHVGQQKLLKYPEVWNAFLANGMTYHALLRNLVRMLQLPNAPQCLDIPRITQQLVNKDNIQRSRVHPIQVLQAMRMVDNKVDPCTALAEVDVALHIAFHESFQNVQPTHKRFLLAVDVSGSMEAAKCVGMPHLTARDAASALALAFLKREPFVVPVAFSKGLTKLPIHKEQTIQEAINATSCLPFQQTDCSLPIEYALEHNMVVDCFVIITDNETNCNVRHPHVVLKEYREMLNPSAKLIVLATSTNSVSIADPKDKGMLDIAGMDSSVFQVMHQFCMDQF